ncbi:unnamed protein product [Rotaria socialis]|uniref:Uncharacterized protein n=1 Tax=Rotaria socialis TaxID=392032 RepID=A0A821RHL9_9BILA|nr:unnamed protein product [Rotaria socialis]CAF4842651.1 unnamed protein product [Rotaria socialis]
MVRKEHLVTHPNLMSIWYHDDKVSIDIMRQMKKHLYNNFPYSRVFSKKEDLLDYLGNKLLIKRIVLILSMKNKKEAESIVKLAKHRSQRPGLNVLPCELHMCFSSSGVESIHSHIENSFNSIVNDLKQNERLSPAATTQTEDEENPTDEAPCFDIFNSTSKDTWLYDLNNESLKFLLFQSLIEVLIRKKYNPNSLGHIWHICRRDYMNNKAQIDRIEELAAEYTPEMAIHYYTQNSCLFRLLSKAFRTEDTERIHCFGCYLADLHQQLEKTGTKQRLNQNNDVKVIYRGKRISRDVLQQLKDSIGHFIALNGLLSTSKSCSVATMFSGLAAAQSDYQSVIFEMHIDFRAAKLIRPYADVKEHSAISDESEVLFFTGFVWKVESVEELVTNGWQIKLQSCTDDASELKKYIEETRRDCSYFTVGKILQELGDYTNASNFYERMLEDQPHSDVIHCDILVHQATLAQDQGKYMEAIKLLKAAEKLVNTTASPNANQPEHRRPLFAHKVITSRAYIFYNMGIQYWRKDDFDSAQNYFTKALKEHGPYNERAAVLNSYGLFQFELGNKEKACEYLQQAVDLAHDKVFLSEYQENLTAARKNL